jgi:hypothetical protein
MRKNIPEPSRISEHQLCFIKQYWKIPYTEVKIENTATKGCISKNFDIILSQSHQQEIFT